MASYKKRHTHLYTHMSDFHLLFRYVARQVKHTLENTSPEPPQVHTITFHSVTLPSHSVAFLNNYLSLHRHIESSDDDYLSSGARITSQSSSRLWIQAFYGHNAKREAGWHRGLQHKRESISDLRKDAV